MRTAADARNDLEAAETMYAHHAAELDKCADGIRELKEEIEELEAAELEEAGDVEPITRDDDPRRWSDDDWKAAHPEPLTCRRCLGSGEFTTHTVNGMPKGPGGICFQCGGKGKQTWQDHRRNFWYEMKGRRVSI